MTSNLKRYGSIEAIEGRMAPDQNGPWVKFDDADVALLRALAIIEKLGTTGSESSRTMRKAQEWIKTYFPNLAE